MDSLLVNETSDKRVDVTTSLHWGAQVLCFVCEETPLVDVQLDARLPIASSALQLQHGMKSTWNERCTDMGVRDVNVMHKEQWRRELEQRHVVTV